MYTFISAFLCSFTLCLLIIRYQKLYHHFTADPVVTSDLRKVHNTPVSRVGGIALFVAVLVASLVRFLQDSATTSLLLQVSCASSAVFFIGLLEDLTKRVRVIWRLLATALTALIAGIMMELWITRVDVGVLDLLLGFPLISIVFTCFAIAGLANAYNIIDGFNGLASMVGVISLVAIAYVAFRLGDTALILAALAMIGAIMGFFVWNYPRGLIFLGDGGAYLIGFWVGILSILLVKRHLEVSPWFALLVNAYPIFETIFSIYRRIHRKVSAGLADGIHLHTLIHRRLFHSPHTPILSSNAQTSPILWVLASLAIIPAVLFWNNSFLLEGFFFLFCLSYVLLYKRIVGFKIPKWLNNSL